jgi:flagellar basal body rod protein FlgC
MKIRCKHCGEFFYPSDESVDLISEGYISSDNVNICDECWDMINHPQDDISDMFSDADPGL